MGDVATMLAEVRTRILAEDATADVLFHDSNLGEHHEEGRRRVVLTWGDFAIRGPRDFCTNPPSLYEVRPSFEAHLYVTDTDDPLSRLQSLLALVSIVARAVHGATHGAHGQGGPELLSMSVTRDTERMRHGEEGILLFDVGLPITRGPAAEVAPGIAPAINGGAGGGGGGGLGLTINPPGV